MVFGNGEYTYELVEDWVNLPLGFSLPDVVAVATDSKDRVYVFNRSDHPMMVFDRDGSFIMSFGEGIFRNPHGVRIDRDDFVYCIDYGDHTVRKLTPEGEVLQILGTLNEPSDTGVIGIDPRTVKRSAGPFNAPTDVSFGPSGDIYVSDGYGNARVHKFSKDGELLSSWGEPGDRQGQFCLLHSICIDRRGRIYVADRENSRIQIFTADGKLITQWKDTHRPTWIYMDRDETVYVSELGYMTLLPGMTAPDDRDPVPRVTIRSINGEIWSWWGGENRCAPGNFFAPHSVCVDSRGDLYIGEVTSTAGAPKDCHSIQKFARKL